MGWRVWYGRPLISKCPKPFFEVRAGQYSWSFDVEVLKLLVVISHFITYMEIEFVQNNDLRNKSYKQFLIENKSGAVRKKLIFDFFFQLKFVWIFFFKFLNIVCPNQIQKSQILYKKKLQSLN